MRDRKQILHWNRYLESKYRLTLMEGCLDSKISFQILRKGFQTDIVMPGEQREVLENTYLYMRLMTLKNPWRRSLACLWLQCSLILLAMYGGFHQCFTYVFLVSVFYNIYQDASKYCSVMMRYALKHFQHLFMPFYFVSS